MTKDETLPNHPYSGSLLGAPATTVKTFEQKCQDIFAKYLDNLWDYMRGQGSAERNHGPHEDVRDAIEDYLNINGYGIFRFRLEVLVRVLRYRHDLMTLDVPPYNTFDGLLKKSIEHYVSGQ